jgi:hypothetical protein
MLFVAANPFVPFDVFVLSTSKGKLEHDRMTGSEFMQALYLQDRVLLNIECEWLALLS